MDSGCNSHASTMVEGTSLCTNCIDPKNASKRHKVKCKFCRGPMIGQHYCNHSDGTNICKVPCNNFWGGNYGTVPKKHCQYHDVDEKKVLTFCMGCYYSNTFGGRFRLVIPGQKLCSECVCATQGCIGTACKHSKHCIDHTCNDENVTYVQI
jgi:hypothetical protein